MRRRPIAYRRRARNEGVVIVIALFALMLLVGLVLFVMNLGQQVDKRVDLQDSADATAAAASTHTARMMNLVSMNNVAMARTIAQINVLDSVPQATHFTYLEQSKIIESLENHLAGAIYTEPVQGGQVESHLREELEKFLEELQEEMDLIRPVEDLFQSGFQMERITNYSGPSGKGQLWVSMEAMDEINRVTVESLPELTQLNAALMAETNMPGDQSARTMVFRMYPVVPWQRGTFYDFNRPVNHGLLPLTIDSPDVNRGPWDAVFGWRHLNSHREGGTWVPGSGGSQVTKGGSGNTPLSGGVNPGRRGGRIVGGTSVVNSYSTFGPQTWLLRRLSNYIGHHLEHTRLNGWLRQMTHFKNRYLWTGGGLRKLREPDWRINWDEATSIADTNRRRIAETGWVIIEIKSRYAPNEAGFMSDGTWSWHNDGGRRAHLRLSRRRGWTQPDPRDWDETIPTVNLVGDQVWRDVWSYEVAYDNQLGLSPNIDGSPHTVYRVDHFFWIGVNVGEHVEIPNPHEGFDPDAAGAPAPTDLAHAEVTQQPESKHQYLSVLAVAKRGTVPEGWPSQFHAKRAYPNQVALAQARVFNTHSWDMWTQMWNAQLVPIDNYDLWVERARAETDAGVPGDVEFDDPKALVTYLENLRDLANLTVGH